MGFLFCVGGMEVKASLGQGFSTSTKRCAGVIPAVMTY
jgi:L-serine dehydratase